MDALVKQQSAQKFKMGDYIQQYTNQKEQIKQIQEETIKQSFRDRDSTKLKPNEKQVSYSPSKHKKHIIIKNGTYPQYLEQIDGVYEGDLDMSYKKEGVGIFIADSGEIYIGEWSGNQMHGEGILHFPFGGYIYGNFKENKIHGIAILQLPQSYVYIGYWKQSKLNGKCFELNVNQREWILSDYKNGELMQRISTEAAEITQSGLAAPKFMEPFEDLKFWMHRLSKKQYFQEREINFAQKHLRYLNIEKGLDYIGFVEDKKIPSGLGLVSYEKRLIYGQYKNGVLDGYGRMILDNGDIYDGQFKNGQFNGIGVYYNFENNTFMYAMFHDNKAIDTYQKGINYPADIIQKVRSQNHKYHRKYYAKELHLERLQILKDFYRLIFDDYEQMYSKVPKEQELYNLGITVNETTEQKQESRKLSNTSTTFIDRLQSSQFGQNLLFNSPKSSDQVIESDRVGGQNNAVGQGNINAQQNPTTNQPTTQSQQQNQGNSKIVSSSNQQFMNQNNLNNIQQTANSAITSSVTQNHQNQNVIQNNQNIISGQSQMQQTAMPPQQQIQSDSNKNLMQFTQQQVQSVQPFSENVVESPVKNERRDVKTNLINANAIGASNIFKKPDRFHEKLLAPPNIVRPQGQQNIKVSQAEFYENFKRELDAQRNYTPLRDQERELVFEEKADQAPVLTKINSSQTIPPHARQKIFQDSEAQEEDEDQQQNRSFTPTRELTRNDTARSTLSQQKYRKNQYLQEINPSKIGINKNFMIRQQGLIMQPKSINEMQKFDQEEPDQNQEQNQFNQPQSSVMWAYNPQVKNIIKIGQPLLQEAQVCQELEKNEDTRDQLIFKANINEQARHKLREIILEEARTNRARKQDEANALQDQLKVRSMSSNNVRRSLLNVSPMKFTEDYQMNRGSALNYNNQKQTIEQLLTSRMQNKENQTISIQSKLNDIRPNQLMQDQIIDGELSSSVHNFGQQSSSQFDQSNYSPLQLTQMAIHQKTKRNIFQPIDQQNFEYDRIGSRYFKNEFRLQEQNNLSQSYAPNKKTRKNIFQPLDQKTSVDRFDKLNSHMQAILQDDDLNGQFSQRDQDNSSFARLSSPLKHSLNQLQNFQMTQQRLMPTQQYGNIDSSRVNHENNSAFSANGRITTSSIITNDRPSYQQSYRPPAGHQRIFSSTYQNGSLQSTLQRVPEDEQSIQMNSTYNPPQIVINKEPSLAFFDNNNRTISFQN